MMDKRKNDSKETSRQNILLNCWEMISRWFNIPLIRNTIMTSGVFAIIIHVLYSIPAPFKFLEHKWEAGDILTYVSTIALGLLALWQNQQIKEANDKAQERMDQQNTEAQERMEKLTIQANELSIISKIIEAETLRIDKCNRVLDSLYEYCDSSKISVCYVNHATDKIKGMAALADWRAHIVEIFNATVYELGRDTCVDIYNIVRHVIWLSTAATNYIDVLMRESADSFDSAKEELVEKQLAFIKARGEYFADTDSKYRKLVYGNMSLSEIREVYCKLNQQETMKTIQSEEYVDKKTS